MMDNRKIGAHTDICDEDETPAFLQHTNIQIKLL